MGELALADETSCLGGANRCDRKAVEMVWGVMECKLPRGIEDGG